RPPGPTRRTAPKASPPSVRKTASPTSIQGSRAIPWCEAARVPDVCHPGLVRRPSLWLMILLVGCGAKVSRADAPGDVPEALRKVRLGEVGRGLDQPLLVTYAPGDAARLFVVEKTGRVKIVRGGKVVEKPFLDYSAKVSRGAEQGLLGLAFHPDYAKNG